MVSGKLKRSEMAALLEANKRGTHITSFTSTKVLALLVQTYVLEEREGCVDGDQEANTRGTRFYREHI